MGQANQMMNEWLQHRNVLEELLESIDDEHIDFRPWEDAMALGELALHIAGWNDVFVSMVRCILLGGMMYSFQWSKQKNLFHRTFQNAGRWKMYAKL
ncbi:hypothetical protein ACA29_01005 [Lederbergia galactosidilytica]|uniref:DinB-like domain-containing protein n=1 Tax=Lederbergia galactosidilytica TaxID=217031 RepID=A0A0Q9YKK2_9BACI|nr:hypothetical protein ACA29_01005 [Lederbergia galactosidilytica]